MIKRFTYRFQNLDNIESDWQNQSDFFMYPTIRTRNYFTDNQQTKTSKKTRFLILFRIIKNNLFRKFLAFTFVE